MALIRAIQYLAMVLEQMLPTGMLKLWSMVYFAKGAQGAKGEEVLRGAEGAKGARVQHGSEQEGKNKQQGKKATPKASKSSESKQRQQQRK